MPRWVAVGLGCVSALGMQALFEIVAGATGVARWPAAHYIAVFGALVIGGYVAGHLVGRFYVFNGALASVLYIFITVTLNALRETTLAREYGLNVLPAIDLVQLTLTDVLAMTGASWGGWLAGRVNRGDERLDGVDR